MADLGMAAAFHQIDEPHQVGVDIGMWIDQRVADARLGREVHDDIELVFAEQLGDTIAVGDVEFVKVEVGIFRDARKACLFQGDGVVVVQVVDAVNRAAAFQQAQCQGRADETGGAGDENIHAVSLSVGTTEKSCCNFGCDICYLLYPRSVTGARYGCRRHARRWY